MKRVELVYFDAGGGHRAAANALQHQIAQNGYPWDVSLMNLQELLDSMDIFRKLTGLRLQDIYNLMLRKGWTLGSAQLLAAMHLIIRMLHPMQVKRLRDYWMKAKPELVVSLVPNFDRALYQSLKLASPETPFVTILTDFADYPPHFWIERGQDQYFICGTRKAVEQTHALGHAPERVMRASGMILNPRFYEIAPVDRAAERRKLSLDPALPAALMLFGGQGSKVMETIVRRLDASALKLQIIAICGHNERLAARLRGLKTRIPLHTVGFTREIPYFMQLADFFIGKPGPGSISEAIHMKLPVIVERNMWTLPQERYNAAWVEEEGVGVVLGSFDGIVPAVEKLLDPGTFAQMQTRLSAIENRAVFEIPEMLRRIIGQTPCPTA
jgi:1,2-diacylglycerol 3-beta-galactosyltransferase